MQNLGPSIQLRLPYKFETYTVKRSSGIVNVKRKKLIALNLFVFTNITREWELLNFWTDLLVSNAGRFMGKNGIGLLF